MSTKLTKVIFAADTCADAFRPHIEKSVRRMAKQTSMMAIIWTERCSSPSALSNLPRRWSLLVVVNIDVEEDAIPPSTDWATISPNSPFTVYRAASGTINVNGNTDKREATFKAFCSQSGTAIDLERTACAFIDMTHVMTTMPTDTCLTLNEFLPYELLACASVAHQAAIANAGKPWIDMPADYSSDRYYNVNECVTEPFVALVDYVQTNIASYALKVNSTITKSTDASVKVYTEWLDNLVTGLLTIDAENLSDMMTIVRETYACLLDFANKSATPQFTQLLLMATFKRYNQVVTRQKAMSKRNQSRREQSIIAPEEVREKPTVTTAKRNAAALVAAAAAVDVSDEEEEASSSDEDGSAPIVRPISNKKRKYVEGRTPMRVHGRFIMANKKPRIAAPKRVDEEVEHEIASPVIAVNDMRDDETIPIGTAVEERDESPDRIESNDDAPMMQMMQMMQQPPLTPAIDVSSPPHTTSNIYRPSAQKTTYYMGGNGYVDSPYYGYDDGTTDMLDDGLATEYHHETSNHTEAGGNDIMFAEHATTTQWYNAQDERSQDVVWSSPAPIRRMDLTPSPATMAAINAPTHPASSVADIHAANLHVPPPMSVFHDEDVERFLSSSANLSYDYISGGSSSDGSTYGDDDDSTLIMSTDDLAPIGHNDEHAVVQQEESYTTVVVATPSTAISNLILPSLCGDFILHAWDTTVCGEPCYW